MNAPREQIEHLLRDEIAPALHLDGWGLEVIELTDGVARIRASAAGGCCPGTLAVVATLLEAELRRRVPEVEVVELVV